MGTTDKYQCDVIFPDEESPFYEMSARDISSKTQFEIILTMEGITPETGNTIQVTEAWQNEAIVLKSIPPRSISGFFSNPSTITDS